MKALNQHFAYLDGIRALAALWVLFGHVAIMLGLRGTDPRVAVDIFMILSGYLMLYQSVIRDADGDFPGFARGFFLRRFFRIAPLYYVVLLYCYATQGSYLAWTTAISAPPGMMLAAQHSGFTAPHALTHVSFLFGLLPQYSVSTLMPDWSLTLEMQFYAIFPLLLLGFRRWSFFLPVMLLIAASCLVARWLTPAFPFPTVLPMKLPLFLVGMLLAWARWKTSVSAVRIMCLLPVIIILAQKDRMIAVMVGAVLLADFGDVAALPDVQKWRGVLMSFLGCAPLRKLADWSYGIYLVHLLILIPLLGLLERNHLLMAQPVGVRFLGVAGILFAASSLVAWLLHHLVELPGIRLGRWLEKKAGSFRHKEAAPESLLDHPLIPVSLK